MGARSRLGVFGSLKSLPACDATRGEVPRSLVVMYINSLFVDTNSAEPDRRPTPEKWIGWPTVGRYAKTIQRLASYSQAAARVAERTSGPACVV
jgi:hypothetical protein